MSTVSTFPSYCLRAKMYFAIFQDVLALVLRMLLSRTFLNEYFQRRPEISTPANSMTRVKEGIALYKHGISPYEGDIYHGNPLLLFFGYYVETYCPLLFELLFPVCDLITAIALEAATRAYLRHLQRKEAHHFRTSDDVDKKADKNYAPLQITDDDIQRLPRYTRLLYLFNPLSISCCIAHTTTSLTNAILAASLALMLKNHLFPAILCVALASYSDFYPFVLIVPIILWFSSDDSGHLSQRRIFKIGLLVVIGSLAIITALLYISSVISEGWSFLSGTYGFILLAEDLTPNLGLFWYFFTEIFDQFRLFFNWVFQLNTVVYVAPLAVCLRNDSVMLFHQLLTIIAVFKSYPSVGDIALVLSFLPALSHFNRFIRHRFIIVVAFMACLTLAPVMWYLWIHSGSANANFYFAVTLIYSAANIFLLTDLLYAHRRRQVHLVHGLKPTVGGKEGVVILE